jgi:uncharacterized protein
VNVTEPIPVVQALFRGVGDGAELLGSRCDGCHTHYFPKSLSCRNPSCVDKRLVEVPLSRTGRLYSYTVQGYRPPPLFRMEPWAPYAIGLVELPEGLRVLGMLTGRAPDEWRVDMPVELVTDPLYRDDQGRDVITYKFRPAVAST